MSQPSMAGVVAQPVAVAVGFSSSREQSNPGMGEQASPRAGRITSHDPGAHRLAGVAGVMLALARSASLPHTSASDLPPSSARR